GLHTFDPAAIGLADYGRGENYVARQIERWSKQYRASETEKIEDMERLMQWHMPPSEAGTGSLVGFDLRALGIPSLDDYVAAYVERTGLDPRPYLAVYSAYNFFRIAAILQGIVGRVRDGTATSVV